MSEETKIATESASPQTEQAIDTESVAAQNPQAEQAQQAEEQKSLVKAEPELPLTDEERAAALEIGEELFLKYLDTEHLPSDVLKWAESRGLPLKTLRLWQRNEAMRWYGTPKALRRPLEQAELARRLGVSDRAIRNWRSSPEWQKAMSAHAKSLAQDILPDAVDQLERHMSDPDPNVSIQAIKFAIDLGVKEVERDADRAVRAGNVTAVSLTMTEDEERKVMRACVLTGDPAYLARTKEYYDDLDKPDA